MIWWVQCFTETSGTFAAYLQATGGETDTTEAMFLECVAVMQPDGVSWSEQIRICNQH